ncbi:hypothetical protein V5N11_017196 [Cardamine amara subsp. amara]|uniref:DC1 domain-containing protein n=1 Tax=Cardamine amara subsp. amara TaxID=228776 RepID=A0ABD1BLJ7_CARAN
MFYRCIECDFRLDIECMREDPPFTIPNSESHQHPLTLFPRPLVEPCGACGLGGNKELGYACVPCNYFVHKKCIVQPHGEELKEIKEVHGNNQPKILRYLKKFFMCG